MSRIESKIKNRGMATGYNPIAAVIKILLIGDNPGDARLIQGMLKDASVNRFELTNVTDLKGGLKRLKDESFDVVLLDLGLPDSQGLDTLSKLLVQEREVPIMVLTGLADEEVGINALQIGAQDYLVKGQVNGAALMRSMRYAIERKRSEESLRKVNRALKVLSECNEVLVRAIDKSELLHKICKIIVEIGGYCFAWVGFAKQGQEESIQQVAYAELINGSFNTKMPSWLKTIPNCYPSIKAIQTGNMFIYRSIDTDSDYALLSAEVKKYGYTSTIAFPLIADGSTFGALSIYSGKPDAFDAEEVKMLKELANDLAYGIMALSTRTARKHAEQELKASLEKLKRNLEKTIDSLASAVEKRDPYTAGHQRRVAQLACAIAKEMNLSKEQIQGIRVAGILHDIGKIGVPAEILTKAGKLDIHEFNIVKTHSKTGFEILEHIEFPWPIAQIVLQHHERVNGSGYPKGLLGKDILFEARIIGVADVVEALSSNRPYRPAFSPERISEEILQNRGTLYDSDVVDAYVKLIADKGFKFGT